MMISLSRFGFHHLYPSFNSFLTLFTPVSTLQLILDLVSVSPFYSRIANDFGRPRACVLETPIVKLKRNLCCTVVSFECWCASLDAGLIPLRSRDCQSRRVMDGSTHLAVDHWWSNQAALYPVRGGASEGRTSCTCRTLGEQNSSIRCWTAASACSAELFRYLACTVSLARLTHLASNSSIKK